MEIERFINDDTRLEPFFHPLAVEKEVEIWIKHDYETHPAISGNKWRKLAYNIATAQQLGFTKLATFGGAFSNHVAAVAAVGEILGWETLAFIRGDELNPQATPTLRQAAARGMKFQFLSREVYRRDKKQLLDELKETHYPIPEGGSNALALKGMQDMIDTILPIVQPTHALMAMGTGCTAASFLLHPDFHGIVIGVSALKNGGFLRQEIAQWGNYPAEKLDLLTNYDFGGYGRTTSQLLEFQDTMLKDYQLPLDKIYTAKAFYALLNLLGKDYFPKGSKILFYHTGGLQGN